MVLAGFAGRVGFEVLGLGAWVATGARSGHGGVGVVAERLVWGSFRAAWSACGRRDGSLRVVLGERVRMVVGEMGEY